MFRSPWSRHRRPIAGNLAHPMWARSAAQQHPTRHRAHVIEKSFVEPVRAARCEPADQRSPGRCLAVRHEWHNRKTDGVTNSTRPRSRRFAAATTDQQRVATRAR